ncbi:two-component system sensor histidine kinase NtrB [Archangium sp.]|uniref:two-component system sensor histidine kinase NtrB n=1 Tax=Archangium sp. TaxID=1872627 RepID=UPI002ED875D1
MRRGFIAGVDAFLTPQQRRLPPDELSQYRVLVSSALSMLVLNALYWVSLRYSTIQASQSVAFVAILAVGSYALVLAVVRWTRSIRIPGLMVCVFFTSAFLSVTLLSEDVRVSSHATGMLIPLLAVYLLGWRLGFVFTAIVCVDVGLFHQLYHSGFGSKRPIFSNMDAWSNNGSTMVALLLGWVLFWLHSSSREQAHSALKRAMETLRESEGKLSSLIESTDDFVMSLDTEGRRVAANQPALRLISTLTGSELPPGGRLFPPEPRAPWGELLVLFQQALTGQRGRTEVEFLLEGRSRTVETIASPVRSKEGQVVGVTFFARDISARKEAEARLTEMHRSLLDVSRQAGMAEVATGVLHNVGNTLNSVNVSVGLVGQHLRGSRVVGLARATELLKEHLPSLSSFLTEDERGRQLPSYLIAISEQLVQEREALLAEVQALSESVEHMKSVVSMQQQNARFVGVMEQVRVAQLLDDALKLQALSFEKQGIQVRREYKEVPPVLVDRHKLLQILFNLLSNARHALLESGRADKQLVLRVGGGTDGERLRIEVADNGTGISPESLPRLFTQGFTTKKDGHGFGLHTSALAAAEMGGALTCTSAGSGQGATFLLELPVLR